MDTHFYDFFLFMGQSNMAGRGRTSSGHPQSVPLCIPGAGYEFRAVSDPTKLYPAAEPFGVMENRENGIYETTPKTGSPVTAFINAYYEETGIPVIGLSASKGGSEIAQWLPGTPFMEDTLHRLNSAFSYFSDRNIIIRHKYMVWCQGETDGQLKTNEATYIQRFQQVLDTLMKHKIEHCFLIRIGHFNSACNMPGAPLQDYSTIMDTQDKICRDNPHVTMVSTKFADMLNRGLMYDAYHYFQEAYNEVGTDAGKNTARFIKSLIH